MTDEPVREFLGGITAAVDYENVEVQLRDRFSGKLAIQACAGAVRLMEINCKPDEFAKSCKEFRDFKKKLGVTGARDLVLDVLQKIPLKKEALYNYLSTNIESYHNFEDMIVAGETFLKLLSKRREREKSEKVKEVGKKPGNPKFQGTCNWCGRKFHKESECWSKKNGRPKVTNSSGIESTDVKINVMDKKKNTSLIIEEFLFGKVPKKGLVDSGAAAGDPEVKLLPSKECCLCGTKEVIPVGACTLNVAWRDKQLRLAFLVLLDKDVPQEYDPIIGLEAMLELEIDVLQLSGKKPVKDFVPKDIQTLNLNNIVVEEAKEDPRNSNENVLKEIQSVLAFDVNEVISKHKFDIGCFPVEVPEIELLPEAEKQRNFVPYKFPKQLYVIGEELIQDMLKYGILVYGPSLYIHNVLVVRKHVDDEVVELAARFRALVDLRPLNRIVRKMEGTSGMNIDEILDMEVGKRWFATVDLSQSYHQFKLREKDRMLFGVYFPGYKPMRYCRLPMGFVNSAAILKYFVSTYLESQMVFYVDDGLLSSRTREEHLESLCHLFSLLKKYNLKLSLQKSTLCSTRIQMLGHELSSEGLQPSEEACRLVRDIKKPDGLDALKRIIGFLSFYRQFVPHMSELTSVMTKQLKKEVKFEWTHECSRNLAVIKGRLMGKPLLYPEDPGKELLVYTDASYVAYGAGVFQEREIEEGKVGKVPLLWWSMKRRNFKKVRNAVFLELHVAVSFYTCYRHKLWNRSITWFLNSMASVRILNTNKTDDPQFAAWCLILCQPFIKFKHVSGSYNPSDFASRDVKYEEGDGLEVNAILRKRRDGTGNGINEDSKDEMAELAQKPVDEVVAKRKRGRPRKIQRIENVVSLDKITDLPFKIQELKNLSAMDKKVLKGKSWELRKNFVIVYEDESERIYVPEHLQIALIKFVHSYRKSAAHAGIEETVRRLKRYVWFEGMMRKTRQIILKCLPCLSRKHEGAKMVQKMVLEWPESGNVWDRLHMDFMGPWATSDAGYRYILTVKCAKSRFCLAFPTYGTTSDEVIQILEERVFNVFGAPRVLVTDNGTGFVSKAMKDLAVRYNYEHYQTTPGNHDSNGCVERLHRSINEKLVINGQYKHWDTYIQTIVRTLNSSYNQTVEDTPFKVMFGRESRDYHLEKLMEGIEESPDPIEDIPEELYAGQLVMLKQWNSSKLDTQYSGPYEIQRTKGANVWIKPVSGGAVIKTHRKFVKKMLVDEWSPEKGEGESSEVKEAESSKGGGVILKRIPGDQHLG
uniref:RNA-directed DNA polymerase n=1 Tax=Strongyloides papillosus TaxID=174720 RepID=A0A0N5BSI2_STREA